MTGERILSMPNDNTNPKGNDTVVDPLDALEAEFNAEITGNDNPDPATPAEPAKPEATPAEGEGDEEGEEGEEGEEEGEDADEGKDDEEEEDEVKLPESASEAQKKAFATIRKQLQDAKKKAVSDEERKKIEFYDTNYEAIERAFYVTDAIRKWEDPKLAAEEFAKNYPEAVQLLTGGKKEGEQPAQPAAPAQPGALDKLVETIDWGALEEESTALASALKTVVETARSENAAVQARLDAATKELSEKNQSIEEKQKQREEQEKQNLEATRRQQVTEMRSGWAENVKSFLSEYDLPETSFNRVFAGVMSSMQEEVNEKAAKTKQQFTLDDYKKIDLNTHLKDYFKDLGVTLKAKAGADNKKKSDLPEGTNKNLSKKTREVPKKPEVKTTADFLDFVESELG